MFDEAVPEAGNQENQEEPAPLPQMAAVWQQTLGWQPDRAQQEQFQHLYQGVLEGNRQFNLTRITDPEEFWEKHLWDSLRGILPLEPIQKVDFVNPEVIDIGTGAGFPGIPVAIAHPTWTITLLDATRKKIAFLETLLTTLNIQNARTLTGRAEQVGRESQHREAYDLALIRAVASAAVCAEYALPLLKVGGVAVLYRGQWTDEEAQALQLVLEPLKGKLDSVEAFTTPLSQGVRHCVYLRKIASTAVEAPRLAKAPIL